MELSNIISLLLYFCVITMCAARSQRWLRQEAESEDCSYPEASTIICSPSAGNCMNLNYRSEENEFRTSNVNRGLVQLIENQRNYDVHAYRLCGDQHSEDITLAEAEQCEPGDRLSSSTIRFIGCNEYFTPADDSLPDLEIYAFINESCNLQYRFLFINTTSKIYS